MTSIALNDEDDCNMLVIYKDDLDTIEFIFMEDEGIKAAEEFLKKQKTKKKAGRPNENRRNDRCTNR